MDSKILEYLIAIADEKNISRAADVFELSQPVLSRHLKKVEDELGVRLFERQHNEMLLTDAGKIYISNARAILYTERKLYQDLEELRRDKGKRLWVTVDPFLRRFYNRNVLPEFEKLNLNTVLTAEEGDIEYALEAIRNDFADISVVRKAGHNDDNVEEVLLFEDEIVLAIPIGWADPEVIEKAEKEGPSIFIEKPFIMEAVDRMMRSEEQRIIQEFGLRPRMVIEAEGSTPIIHLVQKEKGIAFLQAGLASAYSDSVAICRIPMDTDFGIYAIYKRGKLLRKEEKSFIRIRQKTYAEFGEYSKKISGNS